VGIVDSPEDVDAYLADVRTQYANAYGMKVTDQLEIEYKQVETSAKHICPAQAFTNMIAKSIDVKVLGTIIYVNDWPAAVVATEEDAQWVLEQAKAPYEKPSDGSLLSNIAFVEEVRVEEGAADVGDIIEKEAALHNLTIGPGIELKYHIVVTGDALSRIARKHGIKVSDIMIANPHLSDSDKIYPGDKLLVVGPKNSLSIKYTEVVDRQQEEPYETEYIPDDTRFTTQKEVIQEGVVGQSHVKAEITYINGIEVDFNLLEKDVLIAPQNRIVKRGTKSVPKELTLATEGNMAIPLKSGVYTLTSEFGPRNTGIPGASTFHKGIDLAAPKGTPIYASAGGTVHFAGTGTGYGLYIRIKHDGGVETRYGHCSQLLVKKGEKVKKGQIIALVGNTGISSGAHLHFEVRIDGVAVCPLTGKTERDFR
jgi:murein DD-endopeptidase MepM/ murein hydrolase activator NlpD